MLNSIKYGPLYSQNYYRIVKEKNRTYYEVYSLPRTETPPEDYTQVSFVCLRPDGAYEAPATVSSVCRYSRKKIGDMDDFHFHLLRHTLRPTFSLTEPHPRMCRSCWDILM